MDSTPCQAVRLDGHSLNLDNEAVGILQEQGGILLKQATSLETLDPILSQDLTSTTSVTRDVVFNKFIKSILFSTREDGFFITAYIPMRGDVRLTPSGRDEQWETMADSSDLAGLSCTHLGGDSTVAWLIEIDQGLKGEHTGITTRVRANGGDIFVCAHWLERTIPRLEKKPPNQAFAIVIQYLSRSYRGRGRLWPATFTTKILEVAGQDCSKEGDYIVWNRDSDIP